jgi:curved DNA-binding protein CbpA
VTDARRQDALDWYELLQVSPRASQAVIHAAYRVLVRDSHPDVNPTPQAEQRVRQLNEGYRVLSDPVSRARYDLECVRARRHKLASAPASAGLARPRDRGRTRAAPSRSTIVAVPSEDRLPFLTGQIMLALILVVAVGAILLGVATAIDPADNLSVNGKTLFEISGR